MSAAGKKKMSRSGQRIGQYVADHQRLQPAEKRLIKTMRDQVLSEDQQVPNRSALNSLGDRLELRLGVRIDQAGQLRSAPVGIPIGAQEQWIGFTPPRDGSSQSLESPSQPCQ